MFLIQIRREALRASWFPLLVVLIHCFASRGFNLYAVWPAFDIPMHVAGGIAITYFFSSVLTPIEHAGHAVLSRYARFVLLIVLAATAAVFWEFGEWTADWLFHVRSQVGLDDTILDMLLGIVGGAVFALIKLICSPVSDVSKQETH